MVSENEAESDSISLTAQKIKVTPELVNSVASKLHDVNLPIGARFRALFTLRNLGGKLSIDALAHSLKEDKSALLKHEVAYCLGQMRDTHAIPILSEVLSNPNEEGIVRHEAGEALGAIANEECIEVLKQFSTDPAPEVSETCLLALARIEWGMKQKQEGKDDQEVFGPSKFFSVDPAPALGVDRSVEELRKALTARDGSVPLFERYVAMFALRDIGTEEAVDALVASFEKEEPSSLLKHEVAFVLGQVQHPAAAKALSDLLDRKEEHCMVRHEALEALGAIATPEVDGILKTHLEDDQVVVRESAMVSIDMTEYYNSDAFEYADGVVKFNEENDDQE